MTSRILAVLPAAAILTLIAGAPAFADLPSDPAAAGFRPRVPVSAFAAPAAWFDPARLHLSSTMTVGTGLGPGTSALQVTSLSYQFRAPFTMQVRVGNAFGAGSAQRGNSFFLEGLDLAWKPGANSIFRVQFRDVRSPLQYGSYPGFWTPVRDPFGY